MKVSSHLSVLVLFIALVPIDVSADESRSGFVNDSVYISPDKSFQFDIPKLVPPGEFVKDIRESETAFKVVMGDELCRRTYIVQYAQETYADFVKFTEERIATMQIVDMDSRVLGEPHPDAILFIGGMPHVSTCAAMTFGEGGQLVPAETAGSDVAVVFLESGDAYYEFGYLVDAERTFTSFYGGSDVEDVVGELIASFKVIGPRLTASLPPVAPLIRFIGDFDHDHCEFIGPIKGKSSSFSSMATVGEHMSKAKAKLRQEADKMGANAILIRQSKMKTSGWTDYPYMQMKADAFICDSVPAYMAWEIRATK